ncbi:DNA cytosine methyltransferase [Roseibacterium beibuensis]|nr:DNA cytosine methyltransferase [Roseibacterium beibuensis]MCS6623880.1 DNA cytosine methyltransferase [Roseibacterium beibuensis]
MSKKLAVDLFAGSGGLTVGLKRAGFSVVGAVEADALAASTYRKNHPRVRLLEGDIKTIEPATLARTARFEVGELDLLAGCPPCQGFSTLRTLNGKVGIDDPQNELIFDFLRFVRELEPKAVMMENVPGLYGDARLASVQEHLRCAGYESEARVLNARDFGVPQRRRRMVLIALRGTEPVFAKAKSRRRTVRQTIGKMPQPGHGSDPLHDYTVKRSQRVEQIIAAIPVDGGSRAALPKDLRLDCHAKVDGFKDVYGRMSWATQSPTITGGCINPSKGRFLHPEQDRPITLREAALLQGFPRGYHFSLERGRYPAAQMIGNAFPPKFAEHHAREIANCLDNLQTQ